MNRISDHSDDKKHENVNKMKYLVLNDSLYNEIIKESINNLVLNVC